MRTGCETAAEQLQQWDAGMSVWSIELGGLGPGYEQCIQLLAIELVRDNIEKPLPSEENWQEWGDETIHRLAENGFSGAQVGAAKQLAYHWLKEGPAEVLTQVDDDRHIQISKNWPRA